MVSHCAVSQVLHYTVYLWLSICERKVAAIPHYPRLFISIRYVDMSRHEPLLHGTVGYIAADGNIIAIAGIIITVIDVFVGYIFTLLRTIILRMIT